MFISRSEFGDTCPGNSGDPMFCNLKDIKTEKPSWAVHELPRYIISVCVAIRGSKGRIIFDTQLCWKDVEELMKICV